MKKLLFIILFIPSLALAFTPTAVNQGGTNSTGYNAISGGLFMFDSLHNKFQVNSNLTFSSTTNILTVLGTNGRQAQIGGDTYAISTSDGFGAALLSTGYAGADIGWDGGGQLIIGGSDFNLRTGFVYPSLFNSDIWITGKTHASSTIAGERLSTLATSTPWSLLSIAGTSTTGLPFRMPNFLVSTSTLLPTESTSTAFIIDANGKVGIGTTSPGQQLSIAGTLLVTGNGSASSTFQGGVQTAGLSSSNGLTITGGSLFQTNNASNTLSGGLLVNDLRITTGGLTVAGGQLVTSGINITGLTSGGGVLFANTSGTVFNNTNFQWINSNRLTSNQIYAAGQLLTGTSTSLAQLAVANSAGATGPVFMVSTTTAGLATSTAFIIDANGKVGIGTTTPNTQLSVAGGIFVTGSGSYHPALTVIDTTGPIAQFSTSSTFTAGQWPIFTITATTTGTLNFARVAVGTTTTFSATSTKPDAGLRDQFTVDGDIYTSRRYLACDMPWGSFSTPYNQFTGGSFAPLTATTTVCGSLMFSGKGSNAFYGLLGSTTGTQPNYIRVQAGVSGNVSVGNEVSIRQYQFMGGQSDGLKIEAWVRGDQSASSSKEYIVGFMAGENTNNGTYTPSQNIVTSTPRLGGCYFESGTSSPSYWYAACRDSTGRVTWVNTFYQVSAGNDAPFQKLRIELAASSTPVGVVSTLGAASSTTFLIDGQVVSTQNTTPSVQLSPVAGVRALANSGTPSLDISLIRLWGK